MLVEKNDVFSIACALLCHRMWLGLGCHLPVPKTVCVLLLNTKEIFSPEKKIKLIFQAVSD